MRAAAMAACAAPLGFCPDPRAAVSAALSGARGIWALFLDFELSHQGAEIFGEIRQFLGTCLDLLPA